MSEYVWIAIVTLFGFGALAFALLYPIYRHLRREERQNRLEEERATSTDDAASEPSVGSNGHRS
jgi:hypothetical protein